MINFIIFILVLGTLIIVHELGHFIMAKKKKVKVELFSLGFGPKLFSKKIGETSYTVCAIPLGGYVKLAGDNLEEFKGEPFEYLSRTPGERAAIVFFGPFLNYVVAFFCFWMVFLLGFPTLTSKVGEVIDGFGAKEAGILPGDKITAIDSKAVEYWEQLQKIIQEKKEGNIAELEILRGEVTKKIAVKIKETQSQDLFGDKKTIGLIGIRPSEEIVKVKYGPRGALIQGTGRLLHSTFITYSAILRIVTGRLSLKESVTGPLGIFYITSKAAELGVVALLHLIAVLNVSLAIFNLLPIPILDGGHLFLLALEKIKGKYLTLAVDKIINQMGLGFILLLAAFILYNDLVRFGVWEKITRFLVR